MSLKFKISGKQRRWENFPERRKSGASKGFGTRVVSDLRDLILKPARKLNYAFKSLKKNSILCYNMKEKWQKDILRDVNN